MEKLKHLKIYITANPILFILLIAFLPRFLAAIFSKGYGMHDDHFGPIEQPFQIINDPAFWANRGEPHAHSIVYPAIHYLLFILLKGIGINNPQTTMFIVRLLHCFYSLLLVYFGYKLSEILSNQKTALKVGIVLSLIWFLPFLSVRNLIEVVCIPPLLGGFYYIYKHDNEKNKLSKYLIIAGLMFGLSFIFRYQTLMMSGTVLIILLFQKRLKDLLLVLLGFIIITFAIQGTADIFAWGYPFASFIEYVSYNASHGTDYTSGPWYNYILLVTGVIIFPVSLMVYFGYFKNWKSKLLIFLPTLIFFVFHSYFPNKQERFILPFIPIFIVLGLTVWYEFSNHSDFWKKRVILLKGVWIWFWIINSILLITFTFNYSKKSRVEAMEYLSTKQDLRGIFIMGGKLGAIKPPLFYLNKYPIDVYEVWENHNLDSLYNFLNTNNRMPNYAVFYGIENLNQRLSLFESAMKAKLKQLYITEPSFVDNIFYFLNPKHNKNETGFIYFIENK